MATNWRDVFSEWITEAAVKGLIPPHAINGLSVHFRYSNLLDQNLDPVFADNQLAYYKLKALLRLIDIYSNPAEVQKRTARLVAYRLQYKANPFTNWGAAYTALKNDYKEIE